MIKYFFLFAFFISSDLFAGGYSFYYGLHSYHIEKSDAEFSKKHPNYKRQNHNENHVIGLGYKDFVFSTYKNSQYEKIRNYALTSEFKYFGVGAGYGYDTRTLKGEFIDVATYNPTILPMAYLKVPWYTFQSGKITATLQTIIAFNALNTGIQVSF